MSDIIDELLANNLLISAVIGWAAAQIIKTIINLILTRSFDPGRLIGSGGMPSSHSAIVAAVTTAVGIRMGFNSALFAISLTMALITMTDAAGVRRAAGQQAVVLNRVVQEMIENGGDLPEQTLKELLGHTPFQVLVGALIGTILAILIA